ncbi:hypothetical protein [Sphingomonas sp.]|jgi:hypothetical protein|uniref:hypothetical protein n=1 Tax=Sphingomonas sp. TaxID=28214 RepID=UPI002D80BB47|nr:hypothetical protein [Sphingomonas sp.]HEU0044429.1 hypothetical protein [Sphingomonas sp.]
MQRPPSMINFERYYLGALAIGLINTALSWSTYLRVPAIIQAQAAIGSWYLPTVTAIGFLIPLALWYFTARRGSVVAKWFITVFFGFGVLSLLISLGMGSFPSTIAAVLSVVALVLNALAVWMLFKPDAKAWFGERPADSPSA